MYKYVLHISAIHINFQLDSISEAFNLIFCSKRYCKKEYFEVMREPRA